MDRNLYEPLKASVKAENWEAVWSDSFLAQGGESIRRQMIEDEGCHAPANAGSASIIDGIIDRLFSGSGESDED